MAPRTVNSFLVSIMMFVSLAGCASETVSFEDAWNNLLAHFSECSSHHGYDPEITKNFSENGLGTGELKWRECAYVGIEGIMFPASVAPGLFRKMVAEDKSMTKEITKGEMTRKQRKARLTVILNQIHGREMTRNKAREERYKEQDRQLKRQMRRFERSRNPVARRAAIGYL